MLIRFLIIASFFFIVVFESESYNFNIGFDGGLTIPYETTIVGSIKQILEKNGLSLPENGDFGNPDKTGYGLNIKLNYKLTNQFDLTSIFGYWYYDNLNKYGLFTLKTLPFNIGIRYSFPVYFFYGFYGIESLVYLNLSDLTSTVEFGGNKYDVSFSDKFTLYGLSPLFGFSLPMTSYLHIESYHKISLIFRKTYKNLLYFNFFIGIRYLI